MDAFLADVILVVHSAIVAFCVGGELAILAGAVFKWKWIRNLPFRIAHLAMVLYVALEAILGISCPLTVWEYDLRAAAGQADLQNLSFVAQIIRKIIFYDFPPWVFTALYTGFGLLILLTFIFIRPGRKPRTAAGTNDRKERQS
jgi:hypothetical protein